jgi:ribosomal protein S12 methylthiotransferase accessory factor
MTTCAPSLRRLFDVIDHLVDDHVGVVHHVEEVHRESGAPDFFHFSAQACNTQAFTPHKNFGNAGGASVERGIAMAKAIGEAVERYCSAIYRREDFPLWSYDEAPFHCVSPDTFALYGEKQYQQPGFPFVPFTHTTKVRWTQARDAGTAEMIYVPASMVYIPYFFDTEDGESAIAQRISTGLACHCSFEEAVVSAICEVIERDAFTINWQAGLGRPKIRIETLSERNRDLVARFERTGGIVTILNLAMDHGIPTILSVLCSKSSDAPALVFAASADPHPENAVRKSLEELAHTRRLAQHLHSGLPRLSSTATFDDIASQDDHVHLYCNHTNVHLADFILASENLIGFEEIENLSTGDPARDLMLLVEKIRSVGNQVLITDVTTPDIDELGLKVARAIIPGFHPLFMGHKFRALGGTRLWNVPWKLGYRGINRETGDNPAPHPYP